MKVFWDLQTSLCEFPSTLFGLPNFKSNLQTQPISKHGGFYFRREERPEKVRRRDTPATGLGISKHQYEPVENPQKRELQSHQDKFI